MTAIHSSIVIVRPFGLGLLFSKAVQVIVGSVLIIENVPPVDSMYLGKLKYTEEVKVLKMASGSTSKNNIRSLHKFPHSRAWSTASKSVLGKKS